MSSFVCLLMVWYLCLDEWEMHEPCYNEQKGICCSIFRLYFLLAWGKVACRDKESDNYLLLEGDIQSNDHRRYYLFSVEVSSSLTGSSTKIVYGS